VEDLSRKQAKFIFPFDQNVKGIVVSHQNKNETIVSKPFNIEEHKISERALELDLELFPKDLNIIINVELVYSLDSDQR